MSVSKALSLFFEGGALLCLAFLVLAVYRVAFALEGTLQALLTADDVDDELDAEATGDEDTKDPPE